MVRAGELDGVRRLVVLAARPGDETIGDGGLIATAARLGLPVEIVRATDGDAAAQQETLTARVVEVVGDGRGTVIVAPWQADGNPDHEAAGRSAAAAARRTGADLWEHAPEEGPEHYLVTDSADCVDGSLDRLHTENTDPWGVETRWYEQRKRDLVLAMLPRGTFERTIEVGCSTGALAEALATRSETVLAVDSSAAAVAAATRRFREDDRVTVERLEIPREWPQEDTFDLVVVSEVGYFLSPGELESLVQRIAASLAPHGVVVLCHWRHHVEGWVLDADAVHAGFASSSLPGPRATYRDDDVEIRVHAAEPDWPDPTV